jgi:hypothetical protein
MSVFNHIADHGVALIQHFNKAIEKGEKELQIVLFSTICLSTDYNFKDFTTF